MFEKYKGRKSARANAERWHRRAYAVSYEQGRTGNHDAEPVRLYEKAGKEWEVAGDFTRAKDDYIYAFHAAWKANKKKPGTVSRERISELEKWVPKFAGPAWVVLAIGGILGGLFFLSPNITGNTISNINQSLSNVLGAVLLVVGLVGVFFWVKKK